MSRKKLDEIRVSPSKVRTLRARLLEWYDREKRVLPWRDTGDPYRVWLSEIIMQQTRVDQGTPYYERFVAAFPTVETLARAHSDRVMKLWEGLGYYSRARNLHEAAKAVANEFGGVFPSDPRELEMLPGVGRYTAGAIASIAYDVSAPVVDGNVLRVFSRVFDIDAPIDDSAARERCWALAGRLVPRDRPGDFNQALMELGAAVCTPQSPCCDVCPIARSCDAKRNGVVGDRPVRKKKAAVPERTWIAVVIERRGKVLIAQRPANGMLGGLWELPCGEAKPRESQSNAAARIVRERAGMPVSACKKIGEVRHVYSHFKLRMIIYRAESVKGRARAGGYDAIAWVNAEEAGGYALHKATQKAIEYVFAIQERN